MSESLIKVPLAIVGMGCRLPGCDGLDDFWSLLAEGRDGIVPFPDNRLDRELYFDPNKGVRGKTYTQLGGMVPDRPLNPNLVPWNEAKKQDWDDCHLIFGEVAAAACRNANLNSDYFKNSQVGIFIGHSGGSRITGDLVYSMLAEQTADLLNDVPAFQSLNPSTRAIVQQELVRRMRAGRPHRRPGGAPFSDASAVARLVAELLGAHGPQLVLDAACASSLVALGLAALELQANKIDAAIVGGASYNKAESLVLFSHAQSCSATGTRPFDDAADGLISAEGYVALVLKTLDRAIADKDQIHGVIRGLGISSDGKGKSLWAPRREGQFTAIQRAYSDDVRPDDVQFIEAHATSTQVGDATEMQALADFFSQQSRDGKLPIGSVKSNLGHTLETAGLAGLLKTLLGMQHSTIPGTANLKNPNKTIPWETLPFQVPRQSVAWPAPKDRPRCAAVNAFGIGGLNVHLVVEQYQPEFHRQVLSKLSQPTQSVQTKPAIPKTNVARVPIAIVGRGVIVPGATGCKEFESLQTSAGNQICEAPTERWLRHIGVEPKLLNEWKVPVARGGYLLNYAYDWRRHRIPPKQVERANPLQFMLLDAAGQAIEEAVSDLSKLPLQRTAVVVGNAFGGDFGHQLQLGLRIEELRRDLRESFVQQGIRGQAFNDIFDAFEERFFQVNPALLDETGSFTSSTLASRITKQYNLMGGAMAIDSGDMSALAALASSCGLLQTGAVDAVICAAGQRAMDLASFKGYQTRGWLDASANPPHLPGEGVIVFLLKRLSDAQRDNDTVLGIIDDIQCDYQSESPNSASSRLLSRLQIESPSSISHVEAGFATSCLQEEERALISKQFPKAIVSSTRMVEKIGDLKPIQGFVSLLDRLVATDRESPKSSGPELISAISSTGQSYTVLFRRSQAIRSPMTAAALTNAKPDFTDFDQAKNENIAASVRSAAVTMSKPATSKLPILLFRLSANSWGELVNSAKNSSANTASQGTLQSRTGDSSVSAIIVARGEAELREKLSLLASSTPEYLDRLVRQGIIVKLPECSGPRSLVAAFPGQGSQNAHMLSGWLNVSEAARAKLAEAESILREMRSPDYNQLAASAGKAGPSTWPTQASMLITEAVLCSALGFGDAPWSATTGHSLGELAAILAADAWDLRAALTFLRVRATSVDNVEHRGSLLSISADEKRVRQILAGYPAPVVITHVNSPKQVVVGGPSSEVQKFAASLTLQNIGNTVLSVPAAFHTGLMAGAQVALAPAACDANLLPPRTPILSTVSNRYVSDPNEIRRNLIDQLTTPVRYQEVVERLYQDGGRVFVEMGPGQVLTNLHRVILQGRPCVLWSVDRSDGDCERAAAEFQAIKELFGGRSNAFAASPSAFGSSVKSVTLTANPSELKVIDATEVRRKKRREMASHQPMTVQATNAHSQPSHNFDENASTVSGDLGTTSLEAEGPGSGVQQQPDSESSSVELEKFLRDFIVEHTGYPADMIEMDWDLEADLGIDSIKQAQLFGELREMFEFDIKQLASGNVRTLRQMIQLLSNSGGKSEWLDSKLDTDTGSAAQVDSTPTDLSPSHSQYQRSPNEIAEFSPTRSSSEDITSRESANASLRQVENLDSRNSENANDSATSTSKDWKRVPREELARFMVDFVVEHTGYPPDVVALDADFEADLGLDSIKLAQLFGELRNHFQLQIDLSNREVLARCRTLNDILSLFAIDDSVADQNFVSDRDEPPMGESTTTMYSDESNEDSPVNSADYERAFTWARDHSNLIWNRLVELSDRGPSNSATQVASPTALSELPKTIQFKIQGLADGAGFEVDNILQAVLCLDVFPELQEIEPAASSTSSLSPEVERQAALSPLSSTENDICHRYQLSLKRTLVDPKAATQPTWTGAAAVLGNNAIADALVARLTREGVKCLRLGGGQTTEELVEELDRFWQENPIHHMFLASPHDTAAKTQFDPTWWQLRQSNGLRSAFWICQRWIQRLTESNSIPKCTLVGFANLGGQLGLDGQVVSVEGGGIAGLLKAIYIECWVNGFRSLPIKLIDTVDGATPEQAVRAAWYELANPSSDNEIAWTGAERAVIHASPTSIQSENTYRFTKNGNWILTGGGRGITALVAKSVAQRYGVRVHLIGKSTLSEIPDAWRNLNTEETRRLKLEIMDKARKAGKNPIQTWQDTEKLLEVDATLRQCREDGVRAEYYACDVADTKALVELVDRIRQQYGPITGCIHGAGAGQDARFDRKRPDKVEQCLGSKIEGALGLMYATRNDPLECFVGFGSISGRFGANGHTDYSSANDMLAKIIDWYRTVRPDVPATTFHWHAWDDVGMATKPETRLALEMVDMQFMPAREGVNHLMRELEAGLPEREVLVTDDRYFQLFYPADAMQADARKADAGGARSLLLSPPSQIDDETVLDQCVLDPLKETFLREHCLQNRPLLPIVIGLELLTESALLQLGLSDWLSAKKTIQIDDLRAVRGLRFFDDRPLNVKVMTRRVGPQICESTLQCDFHARNGTLVERARPYMQAAFSQGPNESLLGWPAPDQTGFQWESVQYPSTDNAFFVGPAFQVLKKAMLKSDRVYGQILAPALVHLAGAHRDASRWQIPSAVIDACLFTTGILAWKSVRPGISLPVGIRKLVIWTQPVAGQIHTVESRLKRSDDKHAWFDFCLRDQHSKLILEAFDYQISWIES
jgi:acyl transferase domain-containing protein/NAD(P)-dependent dehydrogenase (short-subunit alcohol dehydrogenase family)